MAVTRAQAESVLIGRVGSWLAKAGLSTSVSGQPSDPSDPNSDPNGPNADLNDPIRYALTVMGAVPSDPMAVADSDLIGLDSIGPFALDEFLDRAELRAYKTIQGRFAKTSVMVDGIMVYTSDLLRQLGTIIAQKQAELDRTWGVAGGAVSVGVLIGDSAETLDECSCGLSCDGGGC